MRIATLATALGLGFALSGCVGYNTAVFMTKSNAGLDIDTRPPTFEASIARKEMVIAPSFEGGKTPPVMASFGADLGTTNGLSRFFFGVDQTFAGGDAALTMAKLYDVGAVPAEGAATDGRFDSSLELSAAPGPNAEGASWWKRWLFALGKPGAVKPFAFGTDTQLGVKVGWSGIGAAAPETIKVGFNRREIAVAPVSYTSANNKHHVRIPSFLATVDSQTKGETAASVRTLQYFATGAAANHLARQPQVRAAMLSRLDPAQAATFEELASAQTRIRERAEKVEQILARVTVVLEGSQKVDSTKLTAIANGVSGLDASWVSDFAGKSPDVLSASLKGVDRDSVPALHANLTRLPATP